jgi:predicted glutamine amidotransferase
MCRLFGLTAGDRRVGATFWLLGAPDSLAAQSHRNPDGTGLGTYDEVGRPVIEKQPMAAYDDRAFAQEARARHSSTFVAHVRFATGTPHTPANTHPFEMDGRILAHNGVVGGLDRLEEHLGDDLARVQGDTDSERIFALVTRETARAGGDVSAGIAAALQWLAENVPVFAVNLVLSTPRELWAVRWPETHRLLVLDRRGEQASLDHRSSHGTRVHSPELAGAPSVVVASEHLDDSPGWRMIEPGQLLHVGPDLTIHQDEIVGPPRHRLDPETIESGGSSATAGAEG